ncbi:MAG: cobalamin-binding protein [Melioribacter sp.]|nr:cobalamin-binding protein [Melioribacter sp.]
MRYTKLLLIFLLILVSCKKEEQHAYHKLVVTDDIGNSIFFDKPPQRIITLAPSLTEAVYDLGLEKKLVGNTLYCDYPEDAKKIEKVGDLLNVNYEKMIALRPDIIFITVEGNTKETYNKLKELGLKVFVSNPRNIEGIKKTYLDIAKIFDKKEFAELRISKWDSLINKIKKRSSFLEKKTAMYIVELKPIILAGKNTFINEYLKICGLLNIVEDSPLSYPVFSREEILKRNPDYIIIPDGKNSSIEKLLELYPEWEKLKAIKNKNIIVVNRDNFSRPGPRYSEAIKELFTLLHQGRKDLH